MSWCGDTRKRKPSVVVDKVLRGRRRQVNRDFAAFSGALALDVQFAAPGKGHEKGGVEGEHGGGVFRWLDFRPAISPS